MQSMQPLLMEPILVKDTLLLAQITAARCASTCVQGQQTSVCYRRCTANRMMVVVVLIVA